VIDSIELHDAIVARSHPGCGDATRAQQAAPLR
jgi:hypothetical protein